MAGYENQIVSWKKNYFRSVINIYEPRGPKYHCEECNELFNTRLSIFTHSQIHLKPFCVVCSKYAQNHQEMKIHMKNEHAWLLEVTSFEKSSALEGTDVSQEYKRFSKKRKTDLSKNMVTPVESSFTNEEKTRKKCVISRFGRCINVKIFDF